VQYNYTINYGFTVLKGLIFMAIISIIVMIFNNNILFTHFSTTEIRCDTQRKTEVSRVTFDFATNLNVHGHVLRNSPLDPAAS
jgi:competence protein ComGC